MLAFARKSAGPAVRGLQQARPRGIAVVSSHSQLSNALRPTCLSVSVRHNQQASAESHKFGELDHVRRRLLYRSKQRGWLEMDIMLGNWVSAPSPRATTPRMRHLSLMSHLEKLCPLIVISYASGIPAGGSESRPAQPRGTRPIPAPARP